MGVRLGADATRVLDDARAIARRHRHDVVEPEHVLRALVGSARIAEMLMERAVDPALLAERVDARLAEWPAAGLYRDAPAEVTPSERLHIMLERAVGHRIVSFLRPLTLQQLARSALTLPTLLPVIMDARAEIVTAAHAVAHARMLATHRGDPLLTVFHVTHVLADQPWMAGALEDAGSSVSALQSVLEERIASAGPRDALASTVESLATRALLVAALLQTPAVAAVFSENGVSAHDLRRALVRRSGDDLALDDTTLPDGDGRIEIVFHDDDFTTMEVVVDVLETCLALPRHHALHLMLEVHRGGAKVVKTCAAAEARASIQKARAAARDAEMPLRITWRRETSG
jgi:ATP-dependent Clp protease adaptor protein ClpS